MPSSDIYGIICLSINPLKHLFQKKKTVESKYLPETLFHLENVLKQAELVKQNILFLSQD